MEHTNEISTFENGVILHLRNGVKVIYSNPMITSHNEENTVYSPDDFMYFYYDFEVKKGRKIVFRTSISDNPLVDSLGGLIDLIIEKDTVLMDSFEYLGTTYTEHVARISQKNFLNQEYFAIIEKNIEETITNGETKTHKSYVLTFGEHPSITTSYANKHIFSNDISFRDLSEEQLLDFKILANRFVQFAIENHNRELAENINS